MAKVSNTETNKSVNLFIFYILFIKVFSGIKKSPLVFMTQGLSEKVAASYSPALHCSTIGAIGLNFSVRNGKRWDPDAITT